MRPLPLRLEVQHPYGAEVKATHSTFFASRGCALSCSGSRGMAIPVVSACPRLTSSHAAETAGPQRLGTAEGDPTIRLRNGIVADELLFAIEPKCSLSGWRVSGMHPRR